MTHEDLRSIGEMLREAREAQGLSLEDAEGETRIRLKFLEALENGDLDLLPSPTHARGFLRNYAQFLHLDVDAVVADFATLTGGRPGLTTRSARPAPTSAVREPRRPPAEPPVGAEKRSEYVVAESRVGPAVPRSVAAPPPVPQEESATRARPVVGGIGSILRSWIVTLIVLLVGFVLIIWWTTTKLSQLSGQALVPPSRTPTESTPEMTTSPGTGTPAATSSLQPTLAVTGPAPFSGDGVVVVVDVVQRSWVRILVDGASAEEGLLMPGQTLTYQGNQEVYILTGDGAGLSVTFNGQEIGPLGTRGQVVERFFTAEGMITPTPTSTPTLTGTPVPSPTPSPTP